MKIIRPFRDGSSSATPRHRRVLAIVGDTQVGLWVVRDLARGGLKVYSVCQSEMGLAAHSRYSAGAWRLECGPDDPGFADEVEGLARALDVGSVMTIAEGYHQALIRCRRRFEPDIHLFVPGADVFDRATDKDYMHRLAVELGVPVANGTTLDKLMGKSGEWALRFPLVLRSRDQKDNSRVAPWKCAYAENPDDLARLSAEVAGITSNILVQEYHPGAEDHVQVLMHNREPFMIGEYIGEHHMPLAGGVTVQRVTCRHEPVMRDAVRLLKAIGWEGLCGLQFHYDPRTGEYIFLEINPRFIGGQPTLIMAGFRAAYLLWQSHFEPERMIRGHFRLGMRTRILGGDANWLLGMMRGDPLPPGQKRLGKLSAIVRFLWNFGPWTLDDVFSPWDIKPLIVDWTQMLKRLREKTVDIIGNPETGEGPE